MKYSENNKPLVCMQTNSQCYKNTREMDILGILWHSTGANNPTLKRYVQPFDGTANKEHPENTYTNAQWLEVLGKNSNKNDWNHIDREAGLNFWIGKLADGTVAAVQTMPWNYRPWGCGSGKNGSCNNGWIQFEICEDALSDKAYFEAVYKEACEVTAYLCKKFKIDPKGTVTVNNIKVPTILCHKESSNLGMGSNHGDVLHWFPKFGKDMDDVREDVYALLNPAPVIKPTIAAPKFKIGDEVKVKANSTWESGKTIADWVFSSKMYVRQYKDADSVVISTLKSGDVTGTINESCLEPYATTANKPTTSQPVETKPTTATSKFAVGDEVQVLEGATWSSGKSISSWVFKSKMYVRQINSNGDIVISTVKSGAVTGTINPKYLIAYGKTTVSAPKFTPYLVQITASRLNVRAGASTNDKVITTVKKGENYTVMEEKNGWGKISKGWISLGYTKKV